MKSKRFPKILALLTAATVCMSSALPAAAATDGFERAEAKTQAVSDFELLSAEPAQFDILLGEKEVKAGTPFYIRVTAPSGLFVHRTPSEEVSTRIGTLIYGETAQVIATERPWVKIYYRGIEAWVRTTASDGTVLADTLQENPSSAVTKLTNTEAKVTVAGGVNVHSVAGLNYKVIALLPEGCVVKALAESEHWLNVEFRLNGTWMQGYVVKNYCTLYRGGAGTFTPNVSGSDTEKFTAINGYNAQIVTNGGTLNVRVSPSMRAGVITTLPNSTQVTCIAQSASWYEVTFLHNGRLVQGYIGKTYSRLVKHYGNVRLNKRPLHMSAGEQTRVYLLGLNAIHPQYIDWKVNRAGKNIVTISSSGLVTAKRPGKAIIAGYYTENGVRKKQMAVVTVR